MFSFFHESVVGYRRTEALSSQWVFNSLYMKAEKSRWNQTIENAFEKLESSSKFSMLIIL